MRPGYASHGRGEAVNCDARVGLAIDQRILLREKKRTVGPGAGRPQRGLREGVTLGARRSGSVWTADRFGSSRRSARAAGLVTFAAFLLLCGRAFAAAQVLSATMNGAKVTPPNTSAATGTCSATVDSSTLAVTFSGTFAGLGTSATAAALHGLSGPGGTAPVLLSAASFTTGTSGTFSGSGTLTSEQVAGILAAKTYCEVDDSAFPSGELRGPLSFPSAAPALPPVGVGWLAIALGAMGIALLRTRGRGMRTREGA